MARGRSPARRFERTKRGNVWIDLFAIATPTAVAASTAVLLASLNAAALSLRPFTIVRTRGILVWAADQVGVSEEPFGAFAMQVVTDSAAIAGVASVPTPTTEAGADYFVYVPVATKLTFASGLSVSGGEYVKEFDSKSMRKVGIDDDVVITVENFASGAVGAEIIFGGRMLVKLL